MSTSYSRLPANSLWQSFVCLRSVAAIGWGVIWYSCCWYWCPVIFVPYSRQSFVKCRSWKEEQVCWRLCYTTCQIYAPMFFFRWLSRVRGHLLLEKVGMQIEYSVGQELCWSVGLDYDMLGWLLPFEDICFVYSWLSHQMEEFEPWGWCCYWFVLITFLPVLFVFCFVLLCHSIFCFVVRVSLCLLLCIVCLSLCLLLCVTINNNNIIIIPESYLYTN